MRRIIFVTQSIFRLFTMCIMLCIFGVGLAQSSGDKLYSQGLDLQKIQTIPSQKAAIQKFQSAKKLYDSAAKKKQCDDAIVVSNNIIRTITTNTNKPQKANSQNTKKLEKTPAVLELSNEQLQLDCKSRSITVNITTTESEWSVVPVANDDGESFLSVNASIENGSFEVVCSENNSTQQRSQSIEVRSGELKKVLVVEQRGKPIILGVEKTVIGFSNKGGNKSVEVYSNSDSIEEDNNNRNWRVVSKPEWVMVIGEESKEKGLIGKLGDKAKGLVKKNSTSIDNPSIVISIMKIVVASKTKAQASRAGEIIIKSGDQQATIIVQQN